MGIVVLRGGIDEKDEERGKDVDGGDAAARRALCGSSAAATLLLNESQYS